MSNEFNPAIWGKSAWHFMHLVALSYPPRPTQRDRDLYTAFFFSLGEVLPCMACRRNYKRHWNTYPISEALDSPHDLFCWTVKIRNVIKEELHKGKGEPFQYDVHNMKQHYSNLKSRRETIANRTRVVGEVLILAGVSGLALVTYLMLT